ncbi:MAG: hypothetical protein EP330_20190 [Deltaproteobacteria bacterium]|nr:MAG: hypothetical protein EP330_20190 [Deltaproteobacteria bacterium]
MSRQAPITALVTLLALTTPAAASSVHLSGDRHHALLPPDEPKPERAPGPRVTGRDVVVEPLDDGLRVQVRWTLDSDRPGWFAGTLIGAQFHVESLELGDGLAAHADGGGRHLYGWIDGPTEVEMTAVLDRWTPGTPVDLSLLRAPKGVVVLDSETFELGLTAEAAAEVGDVWWTGAPRLQLQFERPSVVVKRPQAALLTARSGVGLTVLDNELSGKARLSWEVLRGEVAEVAFSGAGTGADLEVSGPNVRNFRREGARIVVELNEPSRGRIDVDVRWTQVLPEGAETRVAAATLRPEAFRVEQSLQLARGGDREVVPRLSGAQPTAASELPLWGQGLIEGTPTAAFTGSGSGQLSLLRFEPVSGPPVVVDVAQYTIATSAEGRVLMRGHYEVRNERAQWLDVRPPAGMRILGARVGADTAFPIEGEAGTWRIPLLRSVETVEGLLTFPVEVAFIGEIGSWDKKEERELDLPVLNAEVALSRVTLYLPPGYTSQLDDTEGDHVPTFSEGESLSYGFAVGETGAAQADALFQEAVSGWMDNDFDKAQGALDDLRAMGGDNENVRRLQSNLDLVSGNYRGDADAASTRRIREQARARSLEEERKAADLKRMAEQAQVAGDYGGSSSYYSEYIELTEKLQRLEQEESVEYKAAEEKARKSLAENAVYEDNWRTASTASVSKKKGGRSKDTITVYDFEDMSISGELTSPDGAYIADQTGLSLDGDAFDIPSTGRNYEVTVQTADPIVLGQPDDDAIASVFDANVDPLGESGGEYANRDLFGEALYGDDGIVGGVEGGVIGGVMGGVSGGSAYGRGAAEVLEPMPELLVDEPMPEPEYERAAGVATASGRGRGGGGFGGGGVSLGGKGKAKTSSRPKPMAPSAAPAPPPPPPTQTRAPRPPEEPEIYEEEEEYWEGLDVAESDDYDRRAPSKREAKEESAVAFRGRRGPSLPSIGMKKKADAGPAYEPDTIELFAEEPDVPEVTATSLSIVVPNLGGETVLYQKLLLTPGDAPSVLVRAKTSKKSK